MLTLLTHDWRKKVRFARSFLARRMCHVNLQLLYACNYRCHICDFWKESHRDRRQLSPAEIRVISEKLNEVGPQIISIGGGEPTLHPDLVEIVRILSAHHLPVMITNGSRITPELARALFAAGMVEISVSLDYNSAEAHDTQRGVPGAFNKAIEALNILHANRTHPEQRVNMIAVVMEDNLPDMEGLIQRSAEMGISFLLTLYSHSRGAKDRKSLTLDASRQLLALKQKYRHFVALRGYLSKFTQAIEEGGIGPCYAGKNLCNIDSQGNVTFCIDRLDESAGNILSDPMPVITERLLFMHKENQCRECWTSCRGSIESVFYGKSRLANLWDYYQMTRPIPLNQRF
jgi:MoaA/NifB/PqqE/SkfB family radical SAM enzyme